MDFLKRLLFPTLNDIMAASLAKSRIQLNEAESDREHADAQIALLNTRITRLEKKLSPETPAIHLVGHRHQTPVR
jgi:hypothetical protein